MTASLVCIHVGDLHMDEADGMASRPRLDAIVTEVNQNLPQADLLFLPGDNANHGTPAQYREITDALAPLTIPWRAIPGDHDVEPGSLQTYEAAFPEPNRPEVEILAGHRCIYLDLVSAGGGGPDFRLATHEVHRLARELARAEADGDTPVVFMHAFPGDLAIDGPAIASLLAESRVPMVCTGHTHYNDLLNDGRVIYGAVRSTAQIEEDEGHPGYAIVCVHDAVPSWRFRRIGTPFPSLQIVSPCDIRLVTRPSDTRHVPRPGPVTVTVRSFGHLLTPPTISLNDTLPLPMAQSEPGLFTATIDIPTPGLHRITTTSGEATDVVDVLVRAADAIPKRQPPIALGHACHGIGAWPIAGVLGIRLGPNSNGCDW